MTAPRMNEVSLRSLAFDDLEPLLRLYAELHPHDDPPPPIEQLRATWRTILESPERIYLGAFVGLELASACSAAIIPNLTRGARPYAVVENVVTLSSYRRKGIGSAIMRRLVELCLARGCYKITLTSDRRRAEIHDFYRSLGFDRDAKQAFVLSARPG